MFKMIEARRPLPLALSFPPPPSHLRPLPVIRSSHFAGDRRPSLLLVRLRLDSIDDTVLHPYRNNEASFQYKSIGPGELEMGEKASNDGRGRRRTKKKKKQRD
jgi:hypothetical protein